MIHLLHHLGACAVGLGIGNLLLGAFVLRKVLKMSTDLDRITTSVAAVKDRDDSIIALVQTLAQQLRDNANDPAAISALADSLDADNQSVVDAVNANTPPAAPAAPTS